MVFISRQDITVLIKKVMVRGETVTLPTAQFSLQIAS
jgi:hypothetical protein